MFKEIRSECAYRLAEKINAGEIRIECTTGQDTCTREELEQLKEIAVDIQGKRCIVPKKEIRKNISSSPD